MPPALSSVPTTAHALTLLIICTTPSTVPAAELIGTTTPATGPLLRAEWIRPGTHVTAVGSDTAEKQELEAGLVARADVVVADSLPQCRVRGLATEPVTALGALG